ncbi:MAG: metallophosphoesterase [Candidatus Nanoarchaeia archaeon]
MTKFIYATDIHGNATIYEKIFSLGSEKDIDFLVFGGDITTGVTPKSQRFFLEFYLLRRIKEFKKKHKKKPIFIMMGNDDFSSNFDILKRATNKKIIFHLHNRFYKFGDYKIAGYPFVNPTPFFLKDWEKSENEILQDLEKLSSRLNPQKTIYVFHAPPFGTSLDLLYNRDHKGSKAIREFIEKNQPLLTLHGHIHESREVSGKIFEHIGKTLCVNPGNGKILLVEIENLKIEEVNV